MNDVWLCLDVSGLAYRAFFSMRDLSHEGVPTAVTFGVLRDVLQLRDLFMPSQILFFFDVGPSKRRDLYPPYKESRSKQLDPEQAKARKAVHRLLDTFREDVLPNIGFSNVISKYGYESDDLMAAVCDRNPQQSMVLVTSDHDMLQCLSTYVSIWQPAKKKIVTKESFQSQWGISPSQWADVLAIAGCSTDNVLGISGIGEKTAVKYLMGSLTSGKKFDAIISGSDVWQRNLELVQLPFKGTPAWRVREDHVTKRSWDKVCREYGITSLRF